ncbi:hypothetical protein BH18ACT10_BH18ACT10_14050 [soil metagenome]
MLNARAASLILALGAMTTVPVAAQTTYRFVPLSPCRIVDTRGPNGPTGGPYLTHGLGRNFPIIGYCNVPSTAAAAALNLTVVNPSHGGHLTVYPAFTSPPAVSNLNFDAGQSAVANGAIIPLTPGSFNVSGHVVLGCGGCCGCGRADLVIDVTGYYRQ